MATAKKYTFRPDYVNPPGATLKEALADRGLSQSDLAARTGLAEKTVSQIINGIAPISVETADKLELVLGISASFWNRREVIYREELTRIDETAKLEDDIEWLKEIPIKFLIERKFIEATEDKPLLVRRALQFFGVSSVGNWRGLVSSAAIKFKGKDVHDKKPGHVAAWRRMGVVQALAMDTAPFDPEEFKRALKEIRNLVVEPASVWRHKVVELCANAGVAVVFVREIPGASVSGLARWVTPEKALIQLSLKYKTDDHVWFTFFHEAGHILKHGKQVFVDYGYSDDVEEEREANDFARDILIPPKLAHRLPYLKSKPQIKAFAEEIGVTAGIVLGRLQTEKFVVRAAFNDLKKKIDWNAL